MKLECVNNNDQKNQNTKNCSNNKNHMSYKLSINLNKTDLKNKRNYQDIGTWNLIDFDFSFDLTVYNFNDSSIILLFRND